jgi:hypothetical protein
MSWFNRQSHRSMVAFAIFLGVIPILSSALNMQVFAQKPFSKIYPTKRVQLVNRSGSIKVEAWNKAVVKVSATFESPVAQIAPEQNGNTLVIDLVRDNKGRKETGDVNFTIYVPEDSDVDVETGLGNITIHGVQGSMVRAQVMLDGDIELTGIKCHNVMASNSSGDIFFDGELEPNGKYQLESVQGKINIRIPANSKFRLTATAPMTKGIDLGGFASNGLRFLSEGRKVTGTVGGEQSTLTVVNRRGHIFFVPR